MFTNARVVTMDPDNPAAQAFLVCGDKLSAVGTEKRVRQQAPPSCEEVDLHGRTVIPGLIETHNHLSHFALALSWTDCSPFVNQSLEDVKAGLQKTALSTPQGEWVFGWGYDDTLLEGARHLTRQDLDEITCDHPVFVQHVSGHLSYVNSAALKMGGVTACTSQPAGGSFDTDDSGEPTGVLREYGAQRLVGGLLPSPGADYFIDTIPQAVAIYNREGITSVHDGAVGMMGQGAVTYKAYQALAAAGRLNLRVYLTTMYEFYDQLLSVGLGRGFGSELLRIGAVKMFQDGSIQGLTAALTQDYHCRSGFQGEVIMPQEQMDELVVRYHRQGLQIAVHANGDRAIESVITAFERAQAKHPQPALRHMIIHCQMASDDHIDRMKALKIIPSYFPNHVFYWGDRHVKMFIGPERAARLDPLGSSVRAGLRFTLHADTPVTPIAPLHSIHCAVNRVTRNGDVLGPDERISVYDALKAFTVDAAYCSHEEDVKGDLSVGKLADFVVLSEDISSVPPEKIRDIKVLATYVGGYAVHQDEQ